MNGNGRMVYSPYGAGIPTVSIDGMHGMQVRWPNQQISQLNLGHGQQFGQEMFKDEGYPYKRHNSSIHQPEREGMPKMQYNEMHLINKVVEKLGHVGTVSKEEIDAVIMENSKIINSLNRSQLMGQRYRLKDIARLQNNLAFLSQLSRSSI